MVGDWMSAEAVDHGSPLNTILLIIRYEGENSGTVNIIYGGGGSEEAARNDESSGIQENKESGMGVGSTLTVLTGPGKEK